MADFTTTSIHQYQGFIMLKFDLLLNRQTGQRGEVKVRFFTLPAHPHGGHSAISAYIAGYLAVILHGSRNTIKETFASQLRTLFTQIEAEFSDENVRANPAMLYLDGIDVSIEAMSKWRDIAQAK